MFNGKKILVAGGTGFLGGALTQRLLAEGALVRATHHSRKPVLMHDNLEWVNADLENQHDCAKVTKGMNYVLMCAASTSGAAEIVKRPLIHLTQNVVMNARMLEASYNSKVKRFLFLSSAAAYPPHGTKPLTEDDMFTDDPADIYFAAGWMKRYTEILCRTYAQKLVPPMSTLVVRPSNVYGPGDKFDWNRSHVTAALIRRVVERQNPIQVWGDGKARRDLIYIDDFSEGTLRALASEDTFMCVNIASGQTYSVTDILQTVMKVDQYSNATVEYDSTRPQTIDMLTLDVRLAKEKLNFEARTSLPDGICKTIAWLKENPSN